MSDLIPAGRSGRAIVCEERIEEPDLCELLSLTLARMGVDSSSVHDVVSARRELQGKQQYALCLTDLRLPDGDGIELLEWIQSQKPELPVAIITAHGHVEAAVRALKLGAFDFVRKPLDISDLRKLVNQALKLSDDRRGAEDGRRLLGDSEPMQKLRQMISRVARSQAPVHITGESGTGKELVARLIHESGFSDITDRTINTNSTTGPIAFTVSDDQTPAASLLLTTRSGNTNPVPDSSIVLGGSGSNRTITVTPPPNAVGTVLISVFATDGWLTNRETFLLTIQNLVPPTSLIPRGASWKYFDQNVDLGASWRSNAFNDATWSSGAARLGYGGDTEVTQVVSNRARITTYFRRTFEVTNPAAFQSLDARLPAR